MVYLSTAYLAPVQQYCKMLQYGDVYLETQENYLKQTYRNRCIIAAANGPLALTIPIVKPDNIKCLTKDIRISDHGNWRKLHWNALVSAYNMSPFFEYYEEDFVPFYEKKFEFLLDYNEALRETICRLIDFEPHIVRTTEYTPYYQVFQEKHGFLPNLSIIDLLFNMGPESLLILQRSIAPNSSILPTLEV